MGLDMYLRATKHISGYLPNGKVSYDKLIETVGLSDRDVSGSVAGGTVSINVAYWRKANAIHTWFVDNCQEGRDDCQSSNVERKQLQELLALCNKVLKEPKKAETLLKTKSGFFFGSIEYDNYFFQDIRDTVSMLTRILDNPKFDEWYFEYQASW